VNYNLYCSSLWNFTIFFLIRFDWFKVRQTENDFNELDEVSQLIQDVREIVYKSEDVNTIAAEVALATLSQYCKDIDLLFIKKARENILFEELRKTLSSTDHKIQTIQWTQFDEDNPERKVLTFWDTINKIPKMEVQEEKLPTPIQEEKSLISRNEESPISSNEESPNTRMEESLLTKFIHELPQLYKDEDLSQIPMKFFLHKQLLSILALLNNNQNDEEKASRALGLTPSQMSYLIQMLSDEFFKRRHIPHTYKNSLVIQTKEEKKRMDKRNKMKRERKMSIRFLDVVTGLCKPRGRKRIPLE